MAIRIVPHAEPHRAAVDAFNLRMRAGGSPWGFYPDPVPDWIPPRAGATVWCWKRFIATRANVSIEPRFAITANGRRPVASGCVDRVVQPLSIPSRNQKLNVQTLKRLGVCVFHFDYMSHESTAPSGVLHEADRQNEGTNAALRAEAINCDHDRRKPDLR